MADDRKRTMPVPTATTTASSSRVGRLSSLTLTSSKFEPVPIVLEISSTVLRVGFAGEKSRPQHIIVLEGPIFDCDYCSGDEARSIERKNRTKTESEWYLVLSPLIAQVYDRLMCKPSTRRVVCMYSNQRYTPLAFRKALCQHLWNRGVPALVEIDPLEVLPIVQGWTRGLAVNITREEAYCICHADGYVLPYTYQMVPPGGYKNWLQSEKRNEINEESMASLVSAVLSCLQKCPRDLRMSVVSNVVFCGDGVLVLPDLPRKVMKKVRDILQCNDNDEERSLGKFPSEDYGCVPLDLANLRSLASSVALTSCAPYRADWICWVGASLWAAVWNKYNDEETPIPWMFNSE
ncbi:unnamed protein product [Pseudo-nitzschia multistriata]|uniref:Actin-related protein 8 n=1 Tax=Pseudo-nitzschia multistriata TaxID=183589 RepID=A0A448ZQ32_9STRA|nr:unnamed protein product [Pseudo-nitzschia multistriata]